MAWLLYTSQLPVHIIVLVLAISIYLGGNGHSLCHICSSPQAHLRLDSPTCILHVIWDMYKHGDGCTGAKVSRMGRAHERAHGVPSIGHPAATAGVAVFSGNAIGNQRVRSGQLVERQAYLRNETTALLYAESRETTCSTKRCRILPVVPSHSSPLHVPFHAPEKCLPGCVAIVAGCSCLAPPLSPSSAETKTCVLWRSGFVPSKLYL